MKDLLELTTESCGLRDDERRRVEEGGDLKRTAGETM